MIKSTTSDEVIQDLQVGDMILLGNSPRLIRDIHWRNGKKHSFIFTIKHRSWTNRPVTSYNRWNLRMKFGGIIKRNCDLVTNSLESRVQYYINTPSDKRDPNWKEYITAEDMAGNVR